ncbi:hypothetical protein EHI8A_143940 [Entamoeba histolytica HM-1:IMSS-B]|uniref:Uncharacterized protein n=6 Tax=Entamoeba histolytica TaxID=5759 RepID=C4M3H7_ENTH1|nr:hypothetical protein EHI_138350 [Entamoeba histolytica HM-1:IMSS]EMD48883.1 Hypothetical protein EHI5A_106410 [Entamoeba histolytica KU27]EMH77468.1 hypothetical protein EHI8A_143940 [Entamoeba histolytica HM-1:IMSS-B]EMS15756.1 hypothetical protein KM1_134990 [Entamoeba histolytica HM-3:IMSS]ENY64512.1 hypothetical protein EHI7A_129880 [Entamoeba histolytica HM-1:IMSS-A]GAT95875.1 hypothetical protein CL6EHI_138350 [Entamoeba histolytica]|eukprot:XP_656844.1 hypothetical protein EHI_138350 [Entamoeba histolytica HM-1:IMSS]
MKMDSTNSVLQGSGIELRKRFYQETQPSNEVFHPKRGFFGNLYQMIFHPIEYFTPKETKLGEVKIQVFEQEQGTVDVKISIEENKHQTPIRSIHLNASSDYQQEINEINEQLRAIVENHFKIGEQSIEFEQPNQPSRQRKSIVYKEKNIVPNKVISSSQGHK